MSSSSPADEDSEREVRAVEQGLEAALRRLWRTRLPGDDQPPPVPGGSDADR